MMHYNFLVNGEYLDIEQGLSLTFKRENMAFAYGKLKLDRTASFEVPATGKNNRLFFIANSPARSGKDTPMRKKVECYLQAGGFETKGFLYIQQAKRDSYSCAFVSGQFLPLQNLSEKKIKEYTSLKDVLVTDGFGTDGEGVPVPPWKGGKVSPTQYVEDLRKYAIMPLDYKSNASEKNVCVNLAYLISECKDLFGIDISLPKRIGYNPLTVICPKFPQLNEEPIYISQLTDVTTGVPFLKTTLNLDSKSITFYRADADGNVIERSAKSCLNFAIEGAKIKFPLDFPDDIFLVSIGNIQWEGNWMNTQPYMLNFLGDYRFEYTATTIKTYVEGSEITYGTPLAGKEVEIPKLDDKWKIQMPNGEEREVYFQPLIFIRKSDLRFKRVVGGNVIECIGLAPSLVSSFEAKISQEDLPVGRVMTFERNTRCFLHQFVPDITYIDLINVYRWVYGMRLGYNSETNTLYFSDYDFMLPDKPSLNLQSKLISVDSVRREVEGFGQSNRILFKQNDNLINDAMGNGRKNHWPIATGLDYEIDNDLIKKDNTLFTIPFSTGDAEFDKHSMPNFLLDVICNDIEVEPIKGDYQIEYEKKERNKEYTIGYIGQGYIGRVTYPFMKDRPDINALCTASTMVQAKFKLSLFEFKNIKEGDVIYFGGVRYVWFNATWSNGVATFTLQKI